MRDIKKDEGMIETSERKVNKPDRRTEIVISILKIESLASDIFFLE